MANPTHFNLEVPQRVHGLICELYDKLSCFKQKELPEASFLLSLSMPILIMPTEHIRQYIKDHIEQNEKNPTDDHACEMKRAFEEEVCNKEFFKCQWQYALYEEKNLPNLAFKELPNDIVDKLNSKKAKECAGKLTTCFFFSILRNALCHGRVLYLDKEGKSSPGATVHNFAFVSKRSTGCYILRIGIDDYRTFLEKWIEWIKKETDGGLLTKCANPES